MMKIRAVAGAVVLLVVGAGNLPLFGGEACGPAPCAPPPVAFEVKVVTCYKPEWRQREEVCCTEKVCTSWTTEVRTRECVSIAVERRPATEVKKVPYFVMVPHQVTIKVPVSAPAPSCSH